MTNKLKYFIGNWKMFGDFTSFKIISRISMFSRSYARLGRKKIVLCVPNTLIYFFKKKLKSKHIFLGAQNCHHEDGFGPYTGSIIPMMLKKIGSEYIIIGHSENRKEGETDKMIKRKIAFSLKNKINIIFCFGETSSEKRKKQTFSVLRKQLKNSLEKKFDFNKILIAYEPVWSIGSNKIPKINELKKIIIFIKKECGKNFNVKKLRVLYGGSVNPQNIRLFSLISNIDGFLIGGASQSAKKFIDIIKNYYK